MSKSLKQLRKCGSELLLFVTEVKDDLKDDLARTYLCHSHRQKLVPEMLIWKDRFEGAAKTKERTKGTAVRPTTVKSVVDCTPRVQKRKAEELAVHLEAFPDKKSTIEDLLLNLAAHKPGMFLRTGATNMTATDALSMKFVGSVSWARLDKLVRFIGETLDVDVPLRSAIEELRAAYRRDIEMRPLYEDLQVNRDLAGGIFCWPLEAALRNLMESESSIATELLAAPCVGAKYVGDVPLLYTEVLCPLHPAYEEGLQTLVMMQEDESVKVHSPLLVLLHVDGKGLFSTEGLLCGFYGFPALDNDSPHLQFPWFLTTLDEKRECLSELSDFIHEGIEDLLRQGLVWNDGSDYAPVIVTFGSDLSCVHKYFGIQGAGSTHGCITCDARTRDGPTAVGEARVIGAMVADAVTYLHQAEAWESAAGASSKLKYASTVEGAAAATAVKGQVAAPLLPCIPVPFIVIDSLHLMLTGSASLRLALLSLTGGTTTAGILHMAARYTCIMRCNTYSHKFCFFMTHSVYHMHALARKRQNTLAKLLHCASFQTPTCGAICSYK